MKKLAKVPVELILKIIYEVADIYCQWYLHHFWPQPVEVDKN